MNMIAQLRRTRISGTIANHKRRVGSQWVVAMNGTHHHLKLKAKNEGATIRFRDADGGKGEKLKVLTEWRPGNPLFTGTINGEPIAIKLRSTPQGYRLDWRGASVHAMVLSPRMAELYALMPVKEAPDTSKQLLCPMPGLVVFIDVAEGDIVEEGQPLATVEAMKMENVLRAERRAKVAALKAEPGDSLAVDAVIMEFEEV